MAISDKKQLDLIAEENALVEDQRNLYRDISKLLEENKNSIYAINNNLAKTISNLVKSENLQEQINSGTSIQRKLNKEIQSLRDKDVEVGKLIYKARNAGIKILRNAYELERKSIRNEIEKIELLKAYYKQMSANAVLLQQQHQLTVGLIRKANVAQAMGLSSYTTGVSSFFNKLALLQGKNIKNANAILNIFSRWYFPIVITYSILNKMFGLFKELDKAAFDFRKQWGFSREGSEIFSKQILQITARIAHLGVTFSDTADAITKIGREMGSVANVSDYMIENVAIFNKQFGISADTSVKFLKTISSISNESINAQRGMMGFTKELSNAYKVPLDEVMNDIAKASASSYAYISKEPLKLIQAAVEARRLGTSLNSLATTSKSLLSFTESIQNEMEASVLLGRPINLQLARQLAYNKDFVGLNKEILKLTKEINYNQLDPYSQAAFARALGKTEEELGKILQSDIEDNALRQRALELAAKGDDRLLKEINNRSKLMQLRKEEAKDVGKIAERNFRNLQNQERLASIADSWRRILTSIGEVILPKIDSVLKVIANIMNNKFISGTLAWSGLLVTVVSTLATMAGSVYYLVKSLKLLQQPVLNFMQSIGVAYGRTKIFISNIGGWVAGLVGKVVSSFSNIFSGIGKMFLKLNPIARIWSAFSAGFAIGAWLNTFKFISEDAQKLLSKIPLSILDGIQSVSTAIYNSITGIFSSAYNWIKNILGFGGESPSKLGLSILNGITSIGSYLFSAITSPFKAAWNYISGLFSSNKIQPSIEKPIINDKLANIVIPVDRAVTGNEIRSYKELNDTGNIGITKQETKANIAETAAATNDTNITLQALLNEIKGLRSDLSAGKIAINMDSQLLSTTMQRNTKFRGSYGAMI